ncbi:cytochrome c-type biogenesis protein (CcmF) [Candidatus Thiomargarita nelsonii]|uniref:Cytochrome c-type biogenesis protein (CcmF) n=1 Tax=Candidatus Thiomargarita nelsonii TaxID=1003181 RepID=A0A176RVZ4_9GAMM|nr:cytochrome c-type biogenesis protein (CcmF) [Candidatus Thiomargarita nelsonii]
MFLLGIGPLARWKNEQVKSLVIRLRYTFIVSIALAVILPVLVMGKAGLIVFPGIAAAAWIVLTSLQNVRDKMSQRVNGLRSLPQSFYGMTTAHIGVAVFVVGVTLSNAFSVEKDVRMAPQKSLELGGYSFIFEGTHSVNGPNYEAEQGLVKVLKNGEQIAVLEPQKRLYRVQRMPMTEAAIDWGFTRDIYVALGEPLDNGAWSVRVYYKPFIRWIWLGGLLMVLGGLLAATDKRYRRTASPRPAT